MPLRLGETIGRTFDGRADATGRVGEAFRAQARERVAARVPLALVVFVVSYATAGILEWINFPERRGGILAFLGFYSALAVGGLILARRPERAVPTMIAAANLVGIATTLYHLLFAASPAYCLLTITALLWTLVVFLPWGWRAQALASIGAST